MAAVVITATNRHRTERVEGSTFSIVGPWLRGAGRGLPCLLNLCFRVHLFIKALPKVPVEERVPVSMCRGGNLRDSDVWPDSSVGILL